MGAALDHENSESPFPNPKKNRGQSWHSENHYLMILFPGCIVVDKWHPRIQGLNVETYQQVAEGTLHASNQPKLFSAGNIGAKQED